MSDRVADTPAGSERSGSEPSRRPNVVLIITDQHRPDHTGFGGHPIASTPNLDSLAARGTVLDRAFAANPICMPNRATLMTGRMPSVHGTRFNGIALDPDSVTVPGLLHEAGYRTAMVGKAHFQNMGMGKDLIEMVTGGAPGRDAVDRRRPDGWDQLEDDARYREGPVALPEQYYGFEHVELAVGHADLMSGHYVQWLAEQGVSPADVQGRDASPSPFAPWWQIWQPALPEELYPTAWVGERAATYVADAGDEPYFLQVSFPDPHHPFTPPGRYYDMFDPADMVLPDTFDDDHAGSPRHLQRWRASRDKPPPELAVQPFSPTEAVFREAAAKELGSIACIDDAIGRVLDAVAASDSAEDTVVVFTSDHGEMFGDHGLMLKSAMHYVPALRVPLVVADPRRPESHGRRSAATVSSTDIAATLMALGGVDAPAGVQGRDLTPVLDDPQVAVREAAVVEEDEPFDMAMLRRPLRMRTLVSDTARLSVYAGSDTGELYDLVEDPDELVNRWHDPAWRDRRLELTDQLMQSMLDLADEGTVPTALA